MHERERVNGRSRSRQRPISKNATKTLEQRIALGQMEIISVGCSPILHKHKPNPFSSYLNQMHSNCNALPFSIPAQPASVQGTRAGRRCSGRRSWSLPRASRPLAHPESARRSTGPCSCTTPGPKATYEDKSASTHGTAPVVGCF